MKPRRKAADKRSRTANYQARHRAEGLCAKCSTPAGLNPHTGRAYHHCPPHRKQAAAIAKPKMQRLRAA